MKAFSDEEPLLMEALKFIAMHPEYNKVFDQEVLNCCFAPQAFKLPVKFNRAIYYERLEGNGEIEKKIYHYVGQNPTWSFSLDMSDPFNRLWMNYFIKTPWFDVDTIGRLYEDVQRLNIKLKNSMAKLSAIMSGKTRVFFTMPQTVEAIKKIFSIKSDEE